MEGRWGGQGISMEVTAKGATLTFDCAHGNIGEPIVLDQSGKFLLAGLVVMERPGPTLRDDVAAGRPATYSGSVDGQNLTLTIKWTGTDETMGTFTLTFGKAGRIRRCS